MPETATTPMNTISILAIDDDPGMLILAQEIFGAEGYRVATASSGMDALSRVRQIEPDVILLDIMMPEMNGYEVCSRIKDIPECKHTPIIVLTGLKEEGDRVAKRLQLESELRSAIKNGELELHYQPLVDNALQRIVGAEALLRCRQRNSRSLPKAFPCRFPDSNVDPAPPLNRAESTGPRTPVWL